jgi:hypothetical protein
MVSGEIKTLMIPDLLTPLSKSAKTRQSFIAFLNNLIEEGVAKITSYAITWNQDVQANVITAVTDEAIRDARHDWAKIGFLSRFILFSYSYSLETVMEIMSRSSSHGFNLDKSKCKLPQKQVNIDLPENIADKLDPLAMKVGEQFNLYGIRAKINFRCLLKCLAYRDNQTAVSETEFKEFVQLAEFMNFKFNPL